jgi:hypothetical protein
VGKRGKRSLNIVTSQVVISPDYCIHVIFIY